MTHVLLYAIFLSFIALSLQSIAGVTYMDHFDFETRYRNIYECDPFYWHPLHLPEHCMKMFERLIRKGVGLAGPTKIVKEGKPAYSFNVDQFDFEDNNDDTMAPYEKMIEMLKTDVYNEPSTPNITVLPGLGVVALYRQPVSRQSGDYIKSMAQAYREYSFGYGPLYYPTTEEPIGNVQSKTNDEKDIIRNIYKNRGKLSIKKKKLKKGGLLTVLTNEQK